MRWKCTKPGCWCHEQGQEYAYSLKSLSELPATTATQEDYIRVCELLHAGTIQDTLDGLDLITKLWPGATWDQLE